MKERGKRVQWLIDQVVVRGVPQEVIDKKTKARQKLWEGRWKRSSESVANVVGALENCKTDKFEILWCKPTEIGGKLDRRKKVDIIVKLKIADINGPQYVNIQVKSNPNDLREFLRKYENSFEEGKTPEERAWNRLAKRRLILLNGRNNAKDIQAGFVSQLERIMSVAQVP